MLFGHRGGVDSVDAAFLLLGFFGYPAGMAVHQGQIRAPQRRLSVFSFRSLVSSPGAMTKAGLVIARQCFEANVNDGRLFFFSVAKSDILKEIQSINFKF